MAIYGNSTKRWKTVYALHAIVVLENNIYYHDYIEDFFYKILRGLAKKYFLVEQIRESVKYIST